jgi:hypothetical protein
MLDLRRREFIMLLGGAAAAWPFAARGQQSSNLPRIGSIHTTRSENSEAFFRGLREGGYVGFQRASSTRLTNLPASLSPSSAASFLRATHMRSVPQ